MPRHVTLVHLRNDRLHVNAQYIQNINTCRKGNQSGTGSLKRSQHFRCTSWTTTHPTFRATQRRKRWSCPPNLLFNGRVRFPRTHTPHFHGKRFSFLYFTLLSPHFHRNHMSFAVRF